MVDCGNYGHVAYVNAVNPDCSLARSKTTTDTHSAHIICMRMKTEADFNRSIIRHHLDGNLASICLVG